MATLADLYDPNTMPPELVKAHAELDRAVEKCYRPEKFQTDRERVEFLFALYEKLTAPFCPPRPRSRPAASAPSNPVRPRNAVAPPACLTKHHQAGRAGPARRKAWVGLQLSGGAFGESALPFGAAVAGDRFPGARLDARHQPHILCLVFIQETPEHDQSLAAFNRGVFGRLSRGAAWQAQPMQSCCLPAFRRSQFLARKWASAAHFLVFVRFRMVFAGRRLVFGVHRLVPESFKIISESFRIISVSFKIVSESFRIISVSFRIVSESFRIISVTIKIVSETFRIIPESFRLVTF